MAEQNYKQSDIAGTTFKRVYQITINNPMDNTPSLVMQEQDVYTLENGKNIFQPCGTLYTALDTTNELHLAIYAKLNELYVLLREARDNG
jgi:hypothetical protein